MSSKRLFWLSIVCLFSTSLLLLSGVFCFLLFFFPGVRFDLADRLNENWVGIAMIGAGLIAVGAGLCWAFWWLSREKFIQVKLSDGSMGLGKELIEKLVIEFWQENFESIPTVAVDGPSRIEITDTSLKQDQLELLENLLHTHLRRKLGTSPEIILSI